MLDTQFETKIENAILESVSDRLYFNKKHKNFFLDVCVVSTNEIC